jgi:hypothetical protein
VLTGKGAASPKTKPPATPGPAGGRAADTDLFGIRTSCSPPYKTFLKANQAAYMARLSNPRAPGVTADRSTRLLSNYEILMALLSFDHPSSAQRNADIRVM